MIKFTDRLIQFDSGTVPFPDDVGRYIEVLGRPSRQIPNIGNDQYIWDDQGIMSYCDPRKTQVHGVLAVFETDQEVPNEPLNGIDCQLVTSSLVIDATTTRDDFLESGFHETKLSHLIQFEISDITKLIARFSRVDRLQTVSISSNLLREAVDKDIQQRQKKFWQDLIEQNRDVKE